VISALSRAPSNEADVKRYLIGILGRTPGRKSLSAVISKLADPDAGIRVAAAEALGRLGDKGPSWLCGQAGRPRR